MYFVAYHAMKIEVGRSAAGCSRDEVGDNFRSYVLQKQLRIYPSGQNYESPYS